MCLIGTGYPLMVNLVVYHVAVKKKLLRFFLVIKVNILCKLICWTLRKITSRVYWCCMDLLMRSSKRNFFQSLPPFVVIWRFLIQLVVILIVLDIVDRKIKRCIIVIPQICLILLSTLLALRRFLLITASILGQTITPNPQWIFFNIILMSSCWEEIFPFVTVRKLVREISGHNPLVLSSRDDDR